MPRLYQKTLPAQPQRDLQLTRVEGCRRRARDLVLRVYISDVEPVGDVEYVQVAVKVHALAEVQATADAQVVEHRSGANAGIDLKSGTVTPVPAT